MPIWLVALLDLFKFIPEKIAEGLLEKVNYFKPPQDRPEVILDRIDRDKLKNEDYFVVKNIGTKTALNISLSAINLTTKEHFFREIILNLIFEFTKIDNLDSKQEKRMDCNIYVIENDGRKVISNSARNLYFGPMFNPKYANVDHHLLFEYNDSSGKKYVTHFIIGKNGIETKSVYLIRKPKSINKMFKRYGIIYKEEAK